MTRRQFLASMAAVALMPSIAVAAPARTFAPSPAGYIGPWRVWGPGAAEADQSVHDWAWEIAPTLDGPFTRVRSHAHEWWEGRVWVGND
jgi:hypothetical protein